MTPLHSHSCSSAKKKCVCGRVEVSVTYVCMLLRSGTHSLVGESERERGVAFSSGFCCTVKKGIAK